MATKTISPLFHTSSDIRTTQPLINAVASPARWIVPLGRALFAAIFLMASLGHFSAPVIGYASQQGVPFAGFLVPFSGVLALLGGLSVLLGYRSRLGALLLLAFLIPVTVMMHKFWGVADPMQAQMQLAMFMKNVALMGAALLIAYFGAGPVSLDSRREAKLEQSK